jgi:acetolactate decarboxylase
MWAVIVGGASCGSPTRHPASPAQPKPIEVRVHGVLHEVMHGQSTAGSIALADVTGPGVIAVGALEGLRGEVTILDGRVTTSFVETSRIATSEGSRDLRAALLVSAKVPSWRELDLREAIVASDLDAAIERRLRAAGVDVSRAIPIVLEGMFPSLDWHVVDGPNHSGILRQSTPGSAVVVGFFSKSHQGVFTHMGQSTHLHVLVRGDTGHVDKVSIAPGATLRIPAP